jgi:hypothetical protein
MTTLYRKKIQCSLCKATNEFTGIGSTNTFHGSADLDTRPPEMMRSTMHIWVQRCPHCGYCASDIGQSLPEAQSIVKSKAYTDQLNDREYPELANSFLCEAQIHTVSGDYKATCWAFIHAAWACDDADCPAQAKLCRLKAADTLMLAEEHGQQIAAQDGSSAAILIDLLRRSRQIEQARQIIAARRGDITDEIMLQVIDFQARLLDIYDLSCHTIEEAIEIRAVPVISTKGSDPDSEHKGFLKFFNRKPPSQ